VFSLIRSDSHGSFSFGGWSDPPLMDRSRTGRSAFSSVPFPVRRGHPETLPSRTDGVPLFMMNYISSVLAIQMGGGDPFFPRPSHYFEFNESRLFLAKKKTPPPVSTPPFFLVASVTSEKFLKCSPLAFGRGNCVPF